jgi:Xaa-Pro aminopeptidase
MLQRLQRLRDKLRARELDALLVTHAANRRYLSGFTGSAGALLISADHAVLLSDFRYAEQGSLEAPSFEFRLIPADSLLPTYLPPLLQALNIRRLGFEAADLSVARHIALQQGTAEAHVQVEWVPTDKLVEDLRCVKDAAEIELLRRAVAVTDDAFAAVRPLLQPTMREREVAWELEKAMRERGAEGIAFDIIVAAGENSARPHAQAGDDQLGTGRPIVIDMGARVDGYHGDMTRTIVLGEADEHFWTIYNIVLAAQQKAATMIRAGMNGVEADAVARTVISEAGFGDAFGHGLGHGVGLAIHEGPRLSYTSQDTLPVGAVFSIEPGIYLPGWGGVRIEDLVLLTDAGPNILTRSSKEPVVEV